MAYLDPAFSTHGLAWSLDRSGAMPAEPDDPRILIRGGVLPWGRGDSLERTTLTPASATLGTAPGEPLDSRTRPAEQRRKWKAALVASCLLHLTTAAFLLAENHDAVMIAGSEQAGVMLLGNAPNDQSAAGASSEMPAVRITLVSMLEPEPVQTVIAASVPAAEAAEPVEAEVAEAAVTVETPVAPTAEAVAVEPEPATPVAEQATAESVAGEAFPAANPVPVILTAQQPVEDEAAVPVPAEQVAEQPPGTATPVEPVKPKEDATGERVVAETVEQAPVEKKTDARTEQPRKKPAKKPAARAERAPPKTAAQRPKSGSGGNSEADARRGAAQGEAGGTTVSASKGGAASAAGNAAVSNYPGKVAARLRRAVRGISSLARTKARSDVRVSFVVDASGGVGSIRIVRGSGSPELDEAALAVVRRAAPFPPIPPQAGRSSWAFTLPLGIAR